MEFRLHTHGSKKSPYIVVLPSQLTAFFDHGYNDDIYRDASDQALKEFLNGKR